MSSQLDLDQGGTFRQWEKVFMGPSVGWVWQPKAAVLTILTIGGTVLQRGTTLVKIGAVNGVVNISLPPSKASLAGPQAIPGQWIITPVTIVDIGGLAGTGPAIYTVFPAAGETISGLASVQLRAPRGSLIFEPLLETGGWNLIQ